MIQAAGERRNSFVEVSLEKEVKNGNTKHTYYEDDSRNAIMGVFL